MTEWTKTFLFVAAGVGSIALAAASQALSRPSAPKEFERVGEQFYPEFDNPLAARTLELVTYDEDTTAIKPFDVTWGDEGWTISPYGYPADAKDQLEKTAASVVGITRTGLASRREGDHERFGVIDPRNEDATRLKGRGSRITLKDEKGQVLADYILGKPVEGNDGYYYVRLPKEKETYIAKVDLNLSTSFSDWIESDLLKINAADLQKIEILDYSLDEDRGTIVGRDRNVLVKGENFGPWTLEGLDEATEQVNTANVNTLTQVLDNLKIIGVRPKPDGLNPDLSLNTEVINNQLSADLLRESLADKGFFLAQAQDGGLQLVAKEGQLIATTNDGVAYDVFFGDQFTGSLFQLEFGDADDAEKPKHLNASDAKGSQTGRYLFIAARFDPKQLGDAPTAPAEPEPPATDAADDVKKAAEDAAKKAQSDYEAAKAQYEEKVADAKSRVEELNARFSEWYYVISTENFKELRLSRDDLVQPKAMDSGNSLPPGTSPAAPTPSGTRPAPVEAPRPTAAADDNE